MTIGDDAAPSQGLADSLGRELRTAEPSIDTVDLDDVRARAERALFGAAEPARLGRFVLLGPIASGGMGTVYSAYDPQLDRRVALKLLRADRRAHPSERERLLAEARALARLDHPNVVPVHDVTEIDEQIVVVMELVAGRTLATWQAERPRHFTEAVAVYAAASRGLAAAHAIGLVHRDFKPHNAVVGDDGRVRVLDFGLAVAADADEQANRGLIGTPAYMAPEQLDGLAATAQSDQFALAVALFRAVIGRPPFAGTTVAELRTHIAAGPSPAGPGDRTVPRWLHAVLERALASAPSDRYPSLLAMLAELERPRGWRRWRLPVIVVGALATSLAVVVATRTQASDPLAACDGGAAEIAAIWDAPQRDQLQRHFDRLAVPYARVVDDQVLTALDAYRESWSGQHRAACVDHRRGALSDRLFDRRMTCLSRRRDALVASVKVLGAIDADSVGRAGDVASGMPRLVDCADRAVLDAAAEPPTTDADRRAVATLRSQLSEADALERAGRSDDALRTAATLVARAEQIGYPPALIEALLVHGRVLLFRGAFADAAPPLRRAEALALENKLWASAVIAGARRLYVDAMRAQPIEPLLAAAAVLVPISRGLPPDPLATPLLLNNLGAVHMANGDRDRARAWFVEAREALISIDTPDLELANIEMNLAMHIADDEPRERATRATWQRLHDRLGEAHPLTLEGQYAFAHFIASLEGALEPTRRTCELYRTFHPGLRAQRIRCLSYQAFLTSELGGDSAALYVAAAELARGHDDPEVRGHGLLATGHAHLIAGAPEQARIAFATALAEIEPTTWWQRVRAGHAHLGLGQAAIAGHRDRDAIAHLERAVAAFTEGLPQSEDVEIRHRLAQSRRLLATATGAARDRK